MVTALRCPHPSAFKNVRAIGLVPVTPLCIGVFYAFDIAGLRGVLRGLAGVLQVSFLNEFASGYSAADGVMPW